MIIKDITFNPPVGSDRSIVVTSTLNLENLKYLFEYFLQIKKDKEINVI